MQIIAGIYKKRKIEAPKGEKVRPTSEQLREALFNICQQRIEEALFLDLFAGSGAVGLEALSRGANHSTFVENDKGSFSMIKRNVAALDCGKSARLLHGDATKMLQKLSKEGREFDIIFADPPYCKESSNRKDLLSEEIVRLIDLSDLLRKGGLLFVEEGKKGLFEMPLKTLELVNARSYGGSTLYQLEKAL